MDTLMCMMVLGYILLFFGLLISVVGEVLFLRVAYRRSLAWFFGCLFIPIVALVFLFLNFRQTMGPVLVGIVGVALFVAGLSLTGMDFDL